MSNIFAKNNTYNKEKSDKQKDLSKGLLANNNLNSDSNNNINNNGSNKNKVANITNDNNKLKTANVNNVNNNRSNSVELLTKNNNINKENNNKDTEEEEDRVFAEDSLIYWDLVLVFSNEPEALSPGGDNLTPAGDKNSPDSGTKSREEIVAAIQHAGLLTYLFLSRDSKLLFLKVGCTVDRLKRAADEMDFQMLLSSEYLRDHVDCGEHPVVDDPEITLYHPYEHIYGKYERENKFHDLYAIAEVYIYFLYFFLLLYLLFVNLYMYN